MRMVYWKLVKSSTWICMRSSQCFRRGRRRGGGGGRGGGGVGSWGGGVGGGGGGGGRCEWNGVGAVRRRCTDNSGESMERGFSQHHEFDDRLPPQIDTIKGNESRGIATG